LKIRGNKNSKSGYFFHELATGILNKKSMNIKEKISIAEFDNKRFQIRFSLLFETH
jgi:hypothetical protein